MQDFNCSQVLWVMPMDIITSNHLELRAPPYLPFSLFPKQVRTAPLCGTGCDVKDCSRVTLPFDASR